MNRQPGIPPPRRVVVVRPGVHDPVLDVVLEPVHAPRSAHIETELQNDHPRKPERLAQCRHRRRDHPEVLRHHRERPELTLERVEQGPARAALPPSRRRRPRPRGHGPVGHEPAEVVDSDGVEMRAGCGARARPTSGIRAGASPASRTPGSPTADRRRENASGGAPPRHRNGTGRGGPGGRRSPAPRRSPRPQTAERHAPPRTPATPPIPARTAPGPPKRPDPKNAPSRPPNTPRAHEMQNGRGRDPRPPARPRIPATPRMRNAICTGIRSNREVRAATSATRSARRGQPVDEPVRLAARDGPPEATLDEAEHRLSAVARSCMSQPQTSPRTTAHDRPRTAAHARPLITDRCLPIALADIFDSTNPSKRDQAPHTARPSTGSKP